MHPLFRAIVYNYFQLSPSTTKKKLVVIVIVVILILSIPVNLLFVVQGRQLKSQQSVEVDHTYFNLRYTPVYLGISSKGEEHFNTELIEYSAHSVLQPRQRKKRKKFPPIKFPI